MSLSSSTTRMVAGSMTSARRFRGHVGGFRGREIHGDASSPSRLAIQLDPASVLADDPIRDGHSEPRPLTDLLCGEKWLEDPVQIPRGDSVAAVLECDGEIR